MTTRKATAEWTDCEICGAPGVPDPADPQGMILCNGCRDSGGSFFNMSEGHEEPGFDDRDFETVDTESDVPVFNDTTHRWASSTKTCDKCGALGAQASEFHAKTSLCPSCESAASKEWFSIKKADISENNVQKALNELQTYIIPALQADQSLTPEQKEKVSIMQSRLKYALENYPVETDFSGGFGDYLSRLVKATLSLKQLIRAKVPIPDEALKEVDTDLEFIYTASVRSLQISLPTPSHMKATPTGKTAMKQEDFVMDKTKLLGKPGGNFDDTNYFDNRELSRKFYSQFFEDAVLVADDGTYYQVLEVVSNSGNFVCMLQDVFYPQIVFTIGVTDLMAHIWKWVSPFDVVVNPALAPSQTQSVSEIISMGNLEKPEVPERWLTY